jgi:hypothetical protein
VYGLVDLRGVNAAGDSHVELSGYSDLRVAEGGNVLLAEAGNQSHVSIAGTNAIATPSQGDAKIANAKGSAVVDLSGQFEVSNSGNGNAVGFSALDNASVLFTGTCGLSESGNGDVIGFTAAGTSSLIYSGTITGSEEGNGASFGFKASGRAHVQMKGGVLDISHSGNDSGSKSFIASNEALIDILGGQFRSATSSAAAFSALDNSIIRFHGTEFNYPFGALPNLSGTLRGTLQDGTLIELPFSRGLNATVLLVQVPETSSFNLAMSSIALWSLSLLPGLRWPGRDLSRTPIGVPGAIFPLA